MSSRIIESAKLDSETDEVSQYLSNYGLKPVVGYFNPLKFWIDNSKVIIFKLHLSTIFRTAFILVEDVTLLECRS